MLLSNTGAVGESATESAAEGAGRGEQASPQLVGLQR